MSDYRLYCLDGDQGIAKGEWFEAGNDQEAVELARTKRLRVKCEVWQGKRLVARIPAYP